eukprot:CAMPEP_0183357734 /NCGR_PEP_ID=MMETSP0164_2-20130417/47172_1 /TAXON_ID=221442 /ORGANISM="Coccolithus pelagicus ssp braarudi, Strain PLY182g" /LENGTH=194 /DNA_ID=CAMNT_0025531441 /DNA_START=323 /DNA_END=904 /DNA_ORIENTATION=-
MPDTSVHGISSQPPCTSSLSCSLEILLGPHEKPSTFPALPLITSTYGKILMPSDLHSFLLLSNKISQNSRSGQSSATRWYFGAIALHARHQLAWNLMMTTLLSLAALTILASYSPGSASCVSSRATTDRECKRMHGARALSDLLLIAWNALAVGMFNAIVHKSRPCMPTMWWESRELRIKGCLPQGDGRRGKVW